MKTMLCGIMILALTFSTGMLSGADENAPKTDAKPKVKTEAAKTNKGSQSEINLVDLKKAIADKTVVLLDCNGNESYAKGHLPGAFNFEAIKDDLVKHLPEDKSALVVAYCGGPQCGAYKAGVKAAKLLGYKQVKHFSGGLTGWEGAGEKLDITK